MGWFWSFLHSNIVRDYRLLSNNCTKNQEICVYGQLDREKPSRIVEFWIQNWNGFSFFLRRSFLMQYLQKLLSTFSAFAFLCLFVFCFGFLVKRGLSNPYTYSYIHMHDLYKYIIYKLATPLGIVHWIDLDNNFYNDNPLFYKTGHQFIGLLVYSERKK